MKLFDLADPEKILTARFSHIISAIFIAITIPTLLMAIDWNSQKFELYLAGKSTFSSYYLLLMRRFFFLFGISYLLALFLALPLFYILRRYLAFKLLTVCLIAAFIAILPNLIIEIRFHLNNLYDDTSTFSSTWGSCKTIVNNQRTFCGWQHFLYHNIFIVGLHGAIAGIVFWFLMRLNYFYKK